MRTLAERRKGVEEGRGILESPGNDNTGVWPVPGSEAPDPEVILVGSFDRTIMFEFAAADVDDDWTDCRECRDLSLP